LSTGAPSINSSGSRNEGDIFVRGFNRFQVPLSIDGVRVYLPADNRIDMNRFLTADLAEVQVAKGYVSVLNGPGGEGGAINMVSRKPTKEVELEGRVGAVFEGDLGSMGQWNAYAFGGTRQRGYYAQVSGTIVDQDHFDMSNDFTPAGPGTIGYANGVAEGFPYEDGGNRDRSDFRDWRINTKVGITPNASDEYSINYTTQKGEKNSRSTPIARSCRVISILTFLSLTLTLSAIGPGLPGILRACRSCRKPSSATRRISRATPTITPSKTRSRSSQILRTPINPSTAPTTTIRSAVSLRWAPTSSR
jgi:outer membrane receptor protein involved in Fe transport